VAADACVLESKMAVARVAAAFRSAAFRR